MRKNDKIRETDILFLKNRLAVYMSKEIVWHSISVYIICKEFVRNLEKKGIKLHKKALLKAALLHDIGKKKCPGKNHHLASVATLTKLFDCKTGEKNRQFAKRVKTIILSHKGEFEPKFDVAMEAAILRMADKIDRFGRNDDAKKKYKKSKKKIRIFFQRNNLDNYDKFNEVCKAIKKQKLKELEK